MRSLLFIMFVLTALPSVSLGQVQLCSAEKLEALRTSLPATEGGKWQSVFRDPKTMFYTDREIPAAYQHADGGLIVNGGRMPVNGASMGTTFHSPRYNISGDAREAAKGQGMGGNANIEFPWRTPGGTDFSEGQSSTFKFMRLPDRDSGGMWPVALYQPTMNDNRIGPHRVMAWVFPVGTIFGEVLAIRDSRGTMHTFEVRLRIREPDYWDIEILRPFPREADLAARLGSDRYVTAMHSMPVANQRLTDTLHRVVGFDVAAGIAKLPPLGESLAAELLDTTPFKSAVGAAWKETAFAPTASEPFSIVPLNYHGTFMGTDTDSCKRCHEHTLRHVDQFDDRRDWYGRVRGSDQIFTWHPIDPSSISFNGGPRAVRLREAFVRAGIVEQFDPAKHPKERYSLLK
jgi:hypothetical protein